MVKERKLPSRKRKPASKGRVIRVSDQVYKKLNDKRKDLSFDTILRLALGIPVRRGKKSKLIEGWLEVNSCVFYMNRAEARGAAVVAAAKAGSKDKYLTPLKLREAL